MTTFGGDDDGNGAAAADDADDVKQLVAVNRSTLKT